MKFINFFFHFIVLASVARAMAANASMKAFLQCLGEDVDRYWIIRMENSVEIYPREVRDLERHGIDRKLTFCIRYLLSSGFGSAGCGPHPDNEIISLSDSEEEYVSITSRTHGAWALSKEATMRKKMGHLAKSAFYGRDLGLITRTISVPGVFFWGKNFRWIRNMLDRHPILR